MCVRVFVWVPVFTSLGYITRSGIDGSCRNSVLALRNCPLFSTVAALFYSPSSNAASFLFPYILTDMISVFMIVAIFVGMKWYLIVVLTWILLTTSEEKAMAPHSSTLAWKIPWMEEPGRLQSMGLLGSDTTEQLHFHFSLSCIGEGNGNPLQCSCLENPRNGGAWWAAFYGVAQSRTRLKWLSNNQWCWTSYHMLVGLLYSFFEEISVQVLCCFSFAKSHGMWDVSFLARDWTVSLQLSLNHWTAREVPADFLIGLFVFLLLNYKVLYFRF